MAMAFHCLASALYEPVAGFSLYFEFKNRNEELRDRAILAVLLGCGLRRSEVAALTFKFKHIQQRDGRWCIVDLVGKHGRVRTVPMPTWVKVAIDAWALAVGISDGPVFRPVNRGGEVRETALSEKVVWQLAAVFNQIIVDKSSLVNKPRGALLPDSIMYPPTRRKRAIAPRRIQNAKCLRVVDHGIRWNLCEIRAHDRTRAGPGFQSVATGNSPPLVLNCPCCAASSLLPPSSELDVRFVLFLARSAALKFPSHPPARGGLREPVVRAGLSRLRFENQRFTRNRDRVANRMPFGVEVNRPRALGNIIQVDDQ